MLNKKLLLLIATIILSSCSANKKSVENNLSTQKEPQKIAAEETSKIEANTMFSVSDEELKKSESGPHVIYFATNSAKLDSEASSTLSEKVLTEQKTQKLKK